MTGAIAIARHEVARRWPLWAISVVLMLASCGVMALDASDEHTWFASVLETCTFAVIVVSWIVAFVVGMGLFGRPLYDGRLAFYFTRPVGGFAIAIGKLLGGVVLILGMEMLLVVPILDERFVDNGSLFALVLAAGFLGSGLIVGILAQSRSRWFVLDAAGGAIVTLIVVAIFDRINDVEMRFRFATIAEAQPVFETVERLLIGLLVAAIFAMYVAVAVAVALGRTDRVRVHRALSTTLWSCLIAIALVGRAYAQWGLR